MSAAAITKSIYVSFYRWNVKNFGYGGLSKTNPLFGVNFLMIILLANLLTAAQLLLSANWFNLSITTGMILLLGAMGALLFNYYVLLNSRFFKKMNVVFAKLSKHNPNGWSVMLLICVILSCGFLLFTCAINDIK